MLEGSTPPPPAWLRSSSASTRSPTTSPTRHDRLQARPRRLPRPRLHAGRPPAAEGVATGAGAAAVDAGRGFAAGRAAAHRQPLDVASRATASSRSGRRRPPGAHARRLAAPRRHRPARHPTRRARPARDHRPRGHDPSRRSRSPPTAPCAPPAAARPHPARHRPLAAGPAARRRQRLRRHRRDRRRRRRAGRDRRSRQGALESSNVDMADAMVDDDRVPARLPAGVQGDPDAGPDDGDRQRGQAMMASAPAIADAALPADVRAAGTRRRQAGLQGRARLRAAARSASSPRSCSTDTPRSPRARAPTPMHDALTDALVGGRRHRPRPAARHARRCAS